jgi:hypothetical protein
MSILKATKNDFAGAISGILDATPNGKRTDLSIIDDASGPSTSIFDAYPERQIHTAMQSGNFRFNKMKNPTSYNLDYDTATPLQKMRFNNSSMSSNYGHNSTTSKILINKYNTGSGGYTNTGPSTAPMVIPIQ